MTKHGVRYPWSDQIWYWLNVSNLSSAFDSTHIPLATVYWSLAVEEQFYALWPAIVRVCSDRALFTVIAVGIPFSITLRNLPLVQAYNVTHPDFIYRLTPFHLDGLLMGSGLALAVRSSTGVKWTRRLLPYTAAIGLTLILIGTPLVDRHNTTLRLIRYGFLGLDLFYLALVATCVIQAGWVGKMVKRFLTLRVMRSLGKYSYFIYVFHLLVIFLVTRATSLLGLSYLDSWKPVIGLAISYCLGAISWRFFESPILSLKKLFPYLPAPGTTPSQT